MKKRLDPESHREICRRRPGMYVGNTEDGSGLQMLVWELLGNALDVYLRGEATGITLDLDGTTIIVTDDGPGLDVTLRDGVSRMVQWLTCFHTSGTADGHLPHVHLRPGFFGHGLALAFFLSERFEIETIRAGWRYRAVGRQGLLEGDLVDLGPDDGRGTCIQMVPDAAIFRDIQFDLKGFLPRMDHLAAFNPGLDLRVQGKHLTFDAGIRDLLLRRTGTAAPLGPLFYHQGGCDDINLEVTLQWFPGGGSRGIQSFLNHTVTPEGGTHVTGLRRALRTVLRRNAVGDGYVWQSTRMDEDLAVVLHIELLNPRFAAPTRDHLSHKEIVPMVAQVLLRPLSAWLADHPDFRQALWCHLGLSRKP